MHIKLSCKTYTKHIGTRLWPEQSTDLRIVLFKKNKIKNTVWKTLKVVDEILKTCSGPAVD